MPKAHFGFPVLLEAGDLGCVAYVSHKIARIVKLLDMIDAVSLINACVLFPMEMEVDLTFIETALAAGNTDSISELLEWYRAKALHLVAGARPGSLCPKQELRIFRGQKQKTA